MNNPLDITGMYGLNNTNTHAMTHTKATAPNMYPIYPQTDDYNNDDMYMPMQSRDMNKHKNTMHSHHHSTENEHTMQNNSQMMTTNNKLPIPVNQNAMQPPREMVNIVVKKPYMQTENVEYMNDLLRTHVGKMAEVEFLIGNDSTHIRRGQLTGVGSNYIVLKEYNTGRTMIADFYNIKFVTLYDQYR